MPFHTYSRAAVRLVLSVLAIAMILSGSVLALANRMAAQMAVARIMDVPLEALRR